MGGLIRYVTKDPSTEGFSGRVEAGGEHVTNGPDLGYSVRGSVNVPVLSNFAFRASGHQVVRDFYAAAIAAGGKDNGAPGPRAHYHEHYYGCFVLDPDGHNFEACCHEAFLG